MLSKADSNAMSGALSGGTGPWTTTRPRGIFQTGLPCHSKVIFSHYKHHLVALSEWQAALPPSCSRYIYPCHLHSPRERRGHYQTSVHYSIEGVYQSQNKNLFHQPLSPSYDVCQNRCLGHHKSELEVGGVEADWPQPVVAKRVSAWNFAVH